MAIVILSLNMPKKIANHTKETLLLDIDNLSIKYGDEYAIKDVSFCIHRGEFVGLIGSNGAGKTTLLKAVLGLIQPTSGKISLDTASIGYVPQRGATYNGIVPVSVLEVVSLGTDGQVRSAKQALAKVQMDKLAHKRFTELSSGQQQRVGIAKALAGGADVLVLDEPATGIDERTQTEFYSLLSDLQSQNVTIILVSHEVDTVLKLATRVICLNRTVLYDGTAKHFEADKYMPQTYKQQHMRLHHHHEDKK